ncbi:hypothetical protein KBD08_01470 [Candidatus Babeliales bacterium]|nr:hypothetical protein [Candidatus Babeliales bacterium]
MKPFRKKTHVSKVAKRDTRLSTKRVEPVVFGEITESLVRKYKSSIDEFIQRDTTVENNELRTLLKQLCQYMNYDILKKVSLPELMKLIPKSQLQQYKSVIQTFVKNDTQRENKDIKHVLQHMLSMMK